MQMANICESWSIPHLNLSDIISPTEITAKLQEIDPKVILCSIEAISDHTIQSELQSLNVSYIAIDECQVATVHLKKIKFD